MIVIKAQDFEMEQYNNTPHFDLKILTIVNAGKANERTEMKVVDRGMPFESCLKIVISNRLLKEDKVYSAKEYIDAFKAEVDKIYSLVEYVDKKADDVELDDSQEIEELEENN